MSDSVIHGMMLDGKKLMLPDTSLDTDGWLTAKDSSSNDTSVQYQIRNGILYVFGYVMAGSTPINLLKIDSKWNLPNGYSAIIDGYVNDNNVDKIYINNSNIGQAGYLISASSSDGSSSTAYMNFSIPVI